MPWKVPQGYFEQMPDLIIERIRIETDELPALLQLLKEQSLTQPSGWPFQAPTGYLEDSPIAAPWQAPSPSLQSQSSTLRPVTPVIPIYKRRYFKYAMAAAVLTALFGLARWYRTANTIDIHKDPNTWVRKEVEKVPTEKIEQYLSSNTIVITPATPDAKKEVESLTKDITEEEIQQLLEETALLPAHYLEGTDTQEIINHP